MKKNKYKYECSDCGSPVRLKDKICPMCKTVFDEPIQTRVEQNPIKDDITTFLRGPADVIFVLGEVMHNETNLSDERAETLRGRLLLMYILTVIISLISIFIIKNNFLNSLGYGLIPTGIYSLITGNALVKVSLGKQWLFLNWKGRIVGILLMIFSIILVFTK